MVKMFEREAQRERERERDWRVGEGRRAPSE